MGGYEQMSPAPKGPPKGMVKGMGGQAFGDLGNFVGTIKNYNAEKGWVPEQFVSQPRACDILQNVPHVLAPAGFGFLDIPALAGRVEGDVFLHSSNLGSFTPGAIVRCTVYLHNGRAQAKNLEEASAADLAASEGPGPGPPAIMDTMGKGGAGMGHIPDQDLGQYVGTDPFQQPILTILVPVGMAASVVFDFSALSN